jgi:hypothetical protein
MVQSRAALFLYGGCPKHNGRFVAARAGCVGSDAGCGAAPGYPLRRLAGMQWPVCDGSTLLRLGSTIDGRLRLFTGAVMGDLIGRRGAGARGDLGRRGCQRWRLRREVSLQRLAGTECADVVLPG